MQSDIDTNTWKKTAGGGADDNRKIIATELANQIKATKPDDKANVLPTPESLQQIFNSVMRKYPNPSVHTKPKKSCLSNKSVRPHRYDDNIPTHKTLQFHDQQKEVKQIANTTTELANKRHVRETLPTNKRSPIPSSMSSSSSSSFAQEMPSSFAQEMPSSFVQNIHTCASEMVQPSMSTNTPNSSNQSYALIFREASKQKSSGPLTLHLKLTSFDFAGQEHYKSMHPCFMTRQAIYIVTFNARDLLSNMKRCIDKINYWVNSILVHTNTNAKVILVGTHRGPYHNVRGFDALTDEQQKYIDRSLKEHLKNLCVFSFFKDDRVMGLVESSIENNEVDSGAKVVRDKLQRLGEAYPRNKEELPLSYLQLESKIFEEISKKKSYLVPRDEVEMWAKDLGIEDINVALDFFHDIGIIINPSKLYGYICSQLL